MGYIDAEKLKEIAAPLIKSGYGDYLMNILKESLRKISRKLHPCNGVVSLVDNILWAFPYRYSFFKKENQ